MNLSNSLFCFLSGEPCQFYFSSRDGTSGEFHSPMWPEPYKTLLHCTYIFQGTREERVKLEFQEFDLEKEYKGG